MFAIEVLKTEKGVMLAPRGELDGSAAWRLVRLAHRFGRTRHVSVDLRFVERMFPFGASVLAQGLGREVDIHSARFEHRPLLRAAGLDRAFNRELRDDDRDGVQTSEHLHAS